MKIYIRKDGADAKAVFDQTTQKVTLLAGSILAIDLNSEPPSNIKQNYDTARENLNDGNIIVNQDGHLEVFREISGLSPSGSAVIVTGRPGSGWKLWKDENDQPLENWRGNGAASQASSEQYPSIIKPPSPTAFTEEVSRKPSTSAQSIPESVCPNNGECIDFSCRFIEHLSHRPKASVDLSNPMDWLEGAFTASAGAGNPKGSKLTIHPNGKMEIEKVITIFLAQLANETVCGQSRYEWLFWRIVHQIENAVSVNSPHTMFSFGRSQKILNIVVKYCYAWWLCKAKPSPKFGDLSWIKKWRPYLHVPVDRETMEFLQRKGYCGLVGRADGTLLSWKWRMSEYNYSGIQDAIRNLAYTAKLDPLCYEMNHIWTV